MELPSQVGRYHVLGLIGKGGMGIVLKARDPGLDREVALKLLSIHGDQAARERFSREARAVAKLQHPNIVTLYELGEHEGMPFMAMELLEGTDLERVIEDGFPPDPRVSIPIVLQVLAGLGHAHEHGIVHRDVKPSNVYMPVNRPAKVLDFGVARLGGSSSASGSLIGTPNYLSPELVCEEAVDGRSDLFATALILYELLVGVKAFPGDNAVALLYKIAHESPDLARVSQVPGGDRLRHILERALARQPRDRYPDAAAMAQALSLALADLGGGLSWNEVGGALPTMARRPSGPTEAPAPAPPAPTPGRGKGRTAAIAAAFALASAAALGTLAWVGWTALRPSAESRAPGAAASAPVVTAPSRPAPTEEVVSVRRRPEAAPTPATSTPGPPAAASAPAVAAASPAVSPPSGTSPPFRAPGPEAGDPLERANRLFEQGRYAPALDAARAVLRRYPDNAEARALAEDAEAALAVEEHLRKARAALAKGDREGCLAAVRAGLALAPNDGRLKALLKDLGR